MPGILASHEAAVAESGRWLEKIRAHRSTERLPDLPPPDRRVLQYLAFHARDFIESDADLAVRTAGFVELLAALAPAKSVLDDEVPSHAQLTIATVRRRQGELDEAERLLEEVRRHLPLGFADPLDEAELDLQEGELLAARGRLRAAIRKGREALGLLVLATAVDPIQDRVKRRIAAWQAAAGLVR